MTKRFLIKKSDLIVLISLFIASFVSIVAGCIFFLFFIFVSRKMTDLAFIFPIFVISVIAFTQYTTDMQGDYDILRYYMHYYVLSDCGIKDGLAYIFLLGDYFFYIIVFIISKIVPADPRFFSFFFSLLTGMIMLSSYKEIVHYCETNRKMSSCYRPINMFVWVFGFVCIISIVNYTNIVRQFFSFSLFILAVARHMNGKHWIIFLIFAMLSHWSMIMYAILYFIGSKYPRTLLKCCAIAFVFGFLDISAIVANFSDRAAAFFTDEEILGVDKTLMLILFLSLLMVIYVLSKIDTDEKKLSVIMYSILFLDAFFLFRSSLATRFYYNFTQYLTILFPIMISSGKIFKKNTASLFMIITFGLIMFYNVKQIIQADFSYQIFSPYSILDSAITIFSTPFPTEML